MYLARDIQAFVMYCVNGTSCSSLLIESIDSMIQVKYINYINSTDLFLHLFPGVLKISLAGANNLVPTTSLTPCIIIIHVYTCNYSGAGKNIDAR